MKRIIVHKSGHMLERVRDAIGAIDAEKVGGIFSTSDPAEALKQVPKAPEPTLVIWGRMFEDYHKDAIFAAKVKHQNHHAVFLLLSCRRIMSWAVDGILDEDRIGIHVDVAQILTTDERDCIDWQLRILFPQIRRVEQHNQLS